ncbi:flavodoxin family protein [Treponema saccharophilum]|uniref:flavodoxin family protein n=1 Tax=Treponema saccharophilum TaxID=165 RepID=UPI003865696E
MNILVLNGSPHENGNVGNAIKKLLLKYDSDENEIVYHNVHELNFDFCRGCMACRKSGTCVLKDDGAHKIAGEINWCDMLIVGTPVYWGNMSGKLKSLFDRLVGVLMTESSRGIPKPLHKGKKAIIVTSCRTPFPFNCIFGQSAGAERALKEILKYS